MAQLAFHFTLGPVQSFVAQARRTRDLWAGSFLLSWLTGHAMKAVLDQGGEITFPRVTENGKIVDPLLRAITGDTHGNTPQIGSIPNRFKAEVGDGFDPDQVTEIVRQKWQVLADTVWERFVAETTKTMGNGTRAIWERQTRGFWEINWILGENPGGRSDDHWLDLRKNWRNHWAEAEGGDHCTIMEDFQEISGYIRAKARTKQAEFWQEIRNAAPGTNLDIRENERLCAIALIKRLFPGLDEKGVKTAIGWIPGGNPEAVGNWPSTTYMAISPWLRHIDDDPGHIEALSGYIQTVHDAVPNGYFKKLASERATHLAMLKQLNVQNMPCGRWKLSDLDGRLLHLHALRNPRSTYLSEAPLTPDGRDNDENIRENLAEALAELYQRVGAKPRSYYALLLMDGDRLGKLLRERDQGAVSRALLAFTQKVRPCVDGDPGHSGVTIYAGGDDVLALLPLDRAIACAQALRRIYGECFAGEGIHATASCAIVFAHHQVPLRSVIHEAHRQLETVAKDRNGRDSLALALYKPGGVTAQWASAWQTAPSPVDRLQELIGALDRGDEYPRGFFHKLRDRYGFYEDEQRAAAPGRVDVQKLLVAEYLQTRERVPERARAETAMERLQAACRPQRRDKSGKSTPAPALNLDGAFIARFLTQEED